MTAERRTRRVSTYWKDIEEATEGGELWDHWWLIKRNKTNDIWVSVQASHTKASWRLCVVANDGLAEQSVFVRQNEKGVDAQREVLQMYAQHHLKSRSLLALARAKLRIDSPGADKYLNLD